MSDYKPQVGDRVRLVFEGTYTSDGPGVNVDGGVYFYADHAMAAAKSIEKIEPPVVTFKPGDVVLERDSGEVRVLGDSGYLHLGGHGAAPVGSCGEWFTYGLYRQDEFTSKRFDKIDLSKALD